MHFSLLDPATCLTSVYRCICISRCLSFAHLYSSALLSFCDGSKFHFLVQIICVFVILLLLTRLLLELHWVKVIRVFLLLRHRSNVLWRTVASLQTVHFPLLSPITLAFLMPDLKSLFSRSRIRYFRRLAVRIRVSPLSIPLILFIFWTFVVFGLVLSADRWIAILAMSPLFFGIFIALLCFIAYRADFYA